MPPICLSRTALLLLLASLAAACSEPSGPSGPDNLDQLDNLVVDATVLETEVAPLPNTRPWIECRVRIDARPVGDVEGPIELDRIDLAFFSGVDREAPVDTLIASPSRLELEFGRRGVYRDTVSSEWDLRADAPYDLRGVVLYTDHDGDSGEAPFAFTCGPRLDGTDPVDGPAVTSLSFAPNASMIEVGAPVTISYKASAPLGLWETWIVVTHTFGVDTIRRNESLAAETSRSVDVPNPSGAPLGSRMSVRVIAIDAALRQADITPVITPVLNDTTRPRLDRAMFVQAGPGACSPVSCQVAAGAPVTANIEAFDASGLVTFRVSYGDPVDRSDEVPLDTDSVVLPPIFETGPVHATGTLIDRYGNATEPFDLGTLQIYPALGDSVTHDAVFDGRTTFRRPDFTRNRLYMAQPGSSTLRVVDFAGLTELSPIELGGVPGGLDVSPDGTVVATIPDAHAIELHAPDGSLVRTIPITAFAARSGYRAGDVVHTAKGTLLVALNRGMYGDGGNGVVLEIDPIAETQTIVGDTSAASVAYHYALIRSGDGAHVVLQQGNGDYPSRTSLLDVVTGVLDDTGMQDLPRLRANIDGTVWAAPDGVWDEHLNLISRGWGVEASDAVVPNPLDSDQLFVLEGRGFARFRTDGVILETRPATELVDGDLWISPDGGLALAAGGISYEPTTTHVTTVRLD